MPVRKKRKALSEVVKSSAPMSVTEVAHEEIASVTHMIVANAKIAITRCLDNRQPFYAKSRRGQIPQNGCDYHSQDEQGEFLESENLAQCVSFVFRHIYLCVYG